MTSIDPAQQLAALIRVQVAALRQRQAPQAGNGRATPARQDDAMADPASVAAQRIRAIPGDDPQRERKALRLFLETVLLAELGESLVNDPAFATMVDHVQRQMESEPQLAQASREAARLLLKSAQG